MAEADVQSIVRGLAALYHTDHDRPWRLASPAPTPTRRPADPPERRRPRRRPGGPEAPAVD